MSQLAMSFGHYRNCGLFAEHFLRTRLAGLPEWTAADGAQTAFATLQRLYKTKASRFDQRTNEAQTERDLIRPALDMLWDADSYEVQVRIPNLDASRQPDYAFFRTAADRDEAAERKGSPEYWRTALVLGDAKAWSVSLDKHRGTDENPTAQICNYLYRSRVRWGILTNGRVWRLYEREKSSAGGIFYEVDLEAIIQNDDFESFKHFYHFFRRGAFLPDAAGVSFVEKVLQGSTDYAVDVGEKLKDSVYDALRVLINGFLTHPANALDPNNPGLLRLVHENCLVLLYRLLFILYAEDRNLLPCDEDSYRTYSLRELHRQVNKQLRAARPYLPATTTLWNRVCNLFALIDEGLKDGERVVIPAYNGGLFSSAKNPHIGHAAQPGTIRWEIGDRHLAEAIDMLAYRRDRWDQPGSQDVDYATLDVQHLGSIYEGLLELRLAVADESLVETSTDKNTVFKPVAQVPDPRPIRGQNPRRVKTGEVYLVTNKGERKATGSYYTPKYIVSYIVEHTVGQLASEASAAVAELRPTTVAEIQELKKRQVQFADTPVEVAKAAQAIEAKKRLLLEPYLGLKILDPAMGSGHFLVGAADFLSLAMATDPNLLTPAQMKDEDPQVYFKRLVVEHCLYGVDLNPLAVELAKLSLWLHTVSRDKALSFLDHHLRRGNSLIGARVEEDLSQTPPTRDSKGHLKKERVPRQLTLSFNDALTATHLQFFLDVFRQIMETPSGSAESERRKDELYREMDKVREEFRMVANCWLAPFFGAAVTAAQFEQAVRALRGTDEERQVLGSEPWFQRAQEVVAGRHLFHWEIEFPEVFFDATGLKPRQDRGFDAVLGNPPYVSFGLRGVGKLPDEEHSYYLATYPGSAEYKVSVYALFMELAVRLAKCGGSQGYVVPDSFLLGKHFSQVRGYLLDETLVSSIVLFREDFWESGTVGLPVVYTVRRRTTVNEPLDHWVNVGIAANLAEFIRKNLLMDSIPQAFFDTSPRRRFRLILGEHVRSLVGRIESRSVPLKQLVKFYSGLIGLRGQESITISSKPSDYSARRYGRLVPSSGSLGRYCVEYADHYCPKDATLYKSGFSPETYENPKLFLNQTGDHLKCCRDDTGYYCLNNMHVGYPVDAQYSLLYTNAVLCSSLMDFYYKTQSLEEGRANAQTDIDVLDLLPIRAVTFSTPPSTRAGFLEEATALTKRFLGGTSKDELLPFVDCQLAAVPQRADAVQDLVAVLAERLIDMNKLKQAEVRGFRLWLERAIGAKVDDLTGKNAVMAYHEHDLEVLLGILRRNRKRLKVDPDSRSFQEKLEREFSASIDKLRPLKQQSAMADRLLDQIVFKLYGLAEDEIAIVEGRTK